MNIHNDNHTTSKSFSLSLPLSKSPLKKLIENKLKLKWEGEREREREKDQIGKECREIKPGKNHFTRSN